MVTLISSRCEWVVVRLLCELTWVDPILDMAYSHGVLARSDERELTKRQLITF